MFVSVGNTVYKWIKVPLAFLEWIFLREYACTLFNGGLPNKNKKTKDAGYNCLHALWKTTPQRKCPTSQAYLWCFVRLRVVNKRPPEVIPYCLGEVIIRHNTSTITSLEKTFRVSTSSNWILRHTYVFVLNLLTYYMFPGNWFKFGPSVTMNAKYIGVN